MAINEEIKTGKKYRFCTDTAIKKWDRYSFWSKAQDTEFNDGTTAEAKLGAIKGITSDVNVTDPSYAASMVTVSELNQNLGGIQFDVDAKGNALAQYTFNGKINTTYLGGGAMTFYGIYGQMNNTGTTNTVSIPVESGKEYTIIIWIDTYAGTTSVLSSMTGATVLSTISERNFNNALNKSWVHIRRIKAVSDTIVITGTMGSSYSNVVWAALFTV